MSEDAGAHRIEALLMALLAVAHYEMAREGADSEKDSRIFKILSRGGVKGSEIAQIFGVSEATVSKRLNA